MNKKVLLTGNSEMVIFKFRLELIERLLKDGYDVYTAFPKTKFGDGGGIAKKYGCHYIELEIDRHGVNPIADLKLINEYKRILKDINPCMLFTYTIKPNIYGAIAARKIGIPCVVNISGLGTAVENPGVLQFITISLYKYALKKVQRVYFQNEENQQFFVDKNLAVDRHALLPGSGVNLERFKLLEYPHNDTIDFMFMARIIKEKGIDQYLEAAEYIKSKYINTRFHVLGVCEDSYYADKLELYKNRDIIEYHGQQKDIISFQLINCCTILPTYYAEGMSNVLLESAACARPIITTNRSGCREIIDDGVNGFICKPKDSNSLIEQIEKFLGLSWLERYNMGLAGRRKVEKEFDRQIVVNAYMVELNSIISRSLLNEL